MVTQVKILPDEQQSGERAWRARQAKQGQDISGASTFTKAERERLDLKLRREIERQGLGAMVAAGAGNFTYVTGIALPFAEQYPDRQAVALRTTNGQACVVCPPDWNQAIRDQGWEGKVVAYSEHDGPSPKALVNALAGAITDLGLATSKIGLDMAGTGQLFVESLLRSTPDVDWAAYDDVLRDLRLVKTPSEVRLLEAAARQSDRAVVSVLNHTEGTIDDLSYSMTEFTERLRVHVGEFGGSVAGHIAATQGADGQLYYVPPHGLLADGNLVRVELTSQHRGYWSNAGRTVVIGQPTEQQAIAYADNVLLKQAAIPMLRPDVCCNTVFNVVAQAAEDAGIEFWQEVGVGHGVGASEIEAPCLNSQDRTRLQPGMVLTLAIYTFGPRREMICSKDTFVVTEEGSCLLSWYRNWNRLYQVAGKAARHG